MNGYQSSGLMYRNCDSVGAWDGDEPECLGLPCPPLMDPDHGVVVTSNDNRFPSEAQ